MDRLSRNTVKKSLLAVNVVMLSFPHPVQIDAKKDYPTAIGQRYYIRCACAHADHRRGSVVTWIHFTFGLTWPVSYCLYWCWTPGTCAAPCLQRVPINRRMWQGPYLSRRPSPATFLRSISVHRSPSTSVSCHSR